ncbi:MAG: DUF5640 domain-containing protein [Acutalibacteraceae bacterium]
MDNENNFNLKTDQSDEEIENINTQDVSYEDNRENSPENIDTTLSADRKGEEEQSFSYPTIEESVSDDSNDSDNTDDSDYSDENISEEAVEKEKKKSSIFKAPIIIAASILVAALIAFGVYKVFFVHSVVGVWQVNDEDSSQADTYIEFTKDGDLIMHAGDLKISGTYENSVDEDGNATLTLNHYYMYGDYVYSITGNDYFGERTLTLGDAEYKGAKLPESKLKVSSKFKADKSLVGSWQYKNESYGIDYIYTFNDDGTMKIYEGVVTADAVYTVSKDTIKVCYYAPQKQNIDMQFQIKSNKLIMNEVEFTKLSDKEAETIGVTEADVSEVSE